MLVTQSKVKWLPRTWYRVTKKTLQDHFLRPGPNSIICISFALYSTTFAVIYLLTKTEPKRYAICKEELRGQRLFEGFRGTITMTLIMLPWRMWWQAILLLSIIASFILNLILLSFKYDGLVIRLVPLIFDVFFLVDIMVHFLHVFWPLLRFHIRVYRRSALLLIYDALTLFPFTILFDFVEKIPYLVLTGRLLTIGRIYRLFTFYQFVNEGLHISRKYIYMLEQFLTVSLMLHAGACAWYGLHNPVAPLTTWSKELGYPPHVTVESLSYTSYLTCWYYASCRTFNVIFGDGFPLTHSEKWLTSVMMIVGYVFIRYEFIGTMAFELVNCSVRRSVFIDRYHHMLHYLKFLGAPTQLVELAKEFKHHLWEMKDGVLTSAHLEKLPLPLQLEFIFDINVQHLHNTVIFRHQSEALLRHISLLMKHELFLPGQHVWSQGVVKTGLLCVKQGVLEMLSDEDDESPMVAFKEGTVLGEVSLFYSIPAKVTVRAATYVELQVLNRTDFMRIMVEHQGMLACSRKIIEDRLASNKKRQRAIEEYDMGDVRLLRAQYRPMKILRDRLMGLEEEDPTFVDDSHLYYRDEDNALQPKFTEDYLELYEITANVTTIDKPRICLRATFPWILEPDTDLTQVFDIIHFIVVMYICLITPFKLIQEYRSDYIKIMDTVVYTGLLLNLYTQCTTAIFKKKIRKETVKDIVEEKMSTVGFYLDLLSIFPMHIFTTTINSYNETMTDQVFLLFPLLQVWHLWNYVEKWEKNFYSNQRLLCVVKYLLIIVIFSYWSGCLLYLYACPQNLCRKNSWMTQLIHWETKVLVTLKARHEQRFFTSISFGLSVFTGSGSDIGPGSSDLVLTIMIFMFGSYLICFYFSKICSLYLLSTQRKHKFKESMRELFYFLTVNHVGSKITARVKKFFCVQWYYNSAVSTDELFENMSNKIRQEVRSIEMVGTLVNCPLFQECSLDFLQTVASSTRTIVLPDNEIVQHSGDIGRDMYILQKGHCNVINQLGNILFSIGPGASIGDVEMMFGLPKVYTILTSTNCILLYLEYISLVQSWSPFPDICDPILRVLEEQELKEVAHQFEESKQTAGRVVIKSNKITQEIKESFVLLTGLKRKQYNEEFDRLGILRHLRYIFLPGCITPHGVFLKIWCGIRFLVAIYYVLIIPYNIATKQHKHIGGYHYIDLIMYFDLIVMGYVAYYNEKNLLVTHPLLTVLRYLKGAFILDVISVMPLEQLVCIVNENTDVDLYRFNRVLLVTRITGAFSYWEDDIMQVNQAVSLLKFLPLAITIVNFMTSLIFTNSCTSFMRPGSPYMFVNCSKSVLTSAEGMYNQYAIKEYAFTFYWLFEIFVGSGCTSVLISKKLDVLFSMVLQILSVLYFALMCGHIASTRSAAAHRLLNHTEKTKDLANFLYQQNVDPALTAKTLKYFEYVWKRTHGSNPQKICRCLNSALMEDTLVFMYEHALREVPLFGKVDRSFIRVITQHLNEMYVLKGETVIQCMDVQHNVFIIYRGKVDVLNSYNEMITCMGPGGMFGNFSGQSNSCSEVTIFASRSLDLLVLPSQTFLNVIKYYPKIQEPLNKAFEVSKDYILPISMDVQPDESSSSDDSDDEVKSFDTFSDSKSASSKFDLPFFANAGQVSLHSSQSSLSQAKSTQSHAFSYRANFHPVNLIMPGSELLLGYGYFLCCIVTVNYVVILYELVTLNDCFIVFWLNGIFDVIFYMKICLEMHQYTWRKLSETVITKSLTGQELNFLKILGYINKHGELVRNAEKCRRRYLKQKFRVWSDVIANIPLECLGFCFKAPLTAMHYFRANKLLRLKYLFEFYKKTAAELTNDLTLLQRISNAAKNILTDSLLTQSPTTLSLPLIIPSEDQRTFIQILPELSAAQDVLLAAQLAMTIFVVILLIHTLSCLWLLALIATQPVSSLRSLRMHLIDEETPLNMWDYTTSLYLIVADMTATGGEELVIENGLPMLLSAAALICGKILAAIVVATSIQVANSRKHALASYEAKIGELIDMLRNQGLSNHQEEKFWQYVRQLWVSERGRQLPGLLNQTPYVRKCDLMSAMFGQHLRNSYLFSGTGEQFLRQVTAALEYTIYFPGNYIVVAGETESRMHWVESGTVAIVSVRTDLTETTHEILHDGDTFGVLQGLQRGVSHCFTYKAQSKASILTLSLDSWINFLPFFPEAQKLIRERTEVLFTRI